MSNDSSAIDDFNQLWEAFHCREMLIGCLGLFLGIFGIIGNIISIIVFTCPSMRTVSTNIYLTAISCSNILYLLVHILQYWIKYIFNYLAYRTGQPEEILINLLDCLSHSPLLVITLFSNVYLTIALSLDRLILVRFPLKANRILTQRITLKIILSICILSILFSIPFLFQREYYSDLKMCRVTSTTYHWYVHIYYRFPILCVIPCIILTFVNIKITKRLLQLKKHKKSLCVIKNKRKQTDYNITLMLVMNTTISILGNLLHIILILWVEWGYIDSVNAFFYYSLVVSSKIFDMLDPSSEFILYCLFVSKYRQILGTCILQTGPSYTNQADLRARTFQLSVKQNRQSSSVPLSIQTHQILRKYDLTISVEINDKSNKNVIITTSLNKEGSPQMVTKPEQISETLPMISKENFNSITLSNDRRTSETSVESKK